ncbi:MAG: acylphosphatase [Bryobacteraceae bacterium]|nr:acylphosphatase [Bryobacteraceae bacterium]MDW8378380.1 acylphosphatase [Bryobacterales bacterium]
MSEPNRQVPRMEARRFLIVGRVQGVGFRSWVQRRARFLGLSGYVRNLEDGSVEVYAMGTAEQLAELARELWQGPPLAQVRAVEGTEAGLVEYKGFFIRA